MCIFEARMRINTSGDYAHREDEIEKAKDVLNAGSKTKAVMWSVETASALPRVVRSVMNRDDLTAAQKRELAAEFNNLPGIDVEYREDVDVTSG